MKRPVFAAGAVVWLVMLPLLCCLAGCRSVGYYGQATRGQLALWWQRRPIQQVIEDPATPAALVPRLRLALEARRFASDRLGLPRNRSYTDFVQLQRRYVVWNVFATPAYSVDPVQHCFPVAGCVAYRGYFSEAAAKDEARRLRATGLDVDIGGVPAYSTLGWFADPVLSSMLAWSDAALAATIFHELAHQRIYVAGDTAFNESYASFVEQQGLREWRQARGLPAPDLQQDELEHDFARRVLALRKALRSLYADPRPPGGRAAAKQAAFDDFRRRYHRWSASRGGAARGYQAWVDGPLNNASLLPFGLYDGWVPGFAHLFADVGGRWPAFFVAARRLAQAPRARRDAELQRLTEGGEAPGHAPATSVDERAGASLATQGPLAAGAAKRP